MRKTPWTSAQVKLFSELYATVPNAVLAVQFGRTPFAIETMGRRLGLLKSKRRRPRIARDWMAVVRSHSPVIFRGGA